MKIICTEKIVCPKCKVELDVPLYQCDGRQHYGMKFCHQCGTPLFISGEEKAIAQSVQKDTKFKNRECVLEIVRGINGTAVTINGYRVTKGKVYGMLVTEARYKLNSKDVLHAVCKEGCKK